MSFISKMAAHEKILKSARRTKWIYLDTIVATVIVAVWITLIFALKWLEETDLLNLVVALIPAAIITYFVLRHIFNLKKKTLISSIVVAAVVSGGWIAAVYLVDTFNGNLSLGYLMTFLPIIVPLFMAIKDVFHFFYIELAVTNTRIIGKKGILKLQLLDIPIQGAMNIKIEMGILGRIFKFGDITIITRANTFEYIQMCDPIGFKNSINKVLTENSFKPVAVIEENKGDMNA